MLTEAVYGDGFIKLADGCDGGHQVWLRRPRVAPPHQVVLGKDALQASSQVPVVDLVETLQNVTKVTA
jgi:hypothetical protein